jgi:hypothetical protein
MLIRNFGLFWRASEINWNPGQGARNEFRMLGRQGTNNPGIAVADFRFQQGIYILYGNYGPYYVGLTRKQGLGKRLKDHLNDRLSGKWDRFSWFGFRETLKGSSKTGIRPLKALPEITLGSPHDAIRDMEALLIKAMGPSNIIDMKFQKATPWVQIENHEVDFYLNKITLI